MNIKSILTFAIAVMFAFFGSETQAKRVTGWPKYGGVTIINNNSNF